VREEEGRDRQWQGDCEEGRSRSGRGGRGGVVVAEEHLVDGGNFGALGEGGVRVH
jgi:hypothetical protein